MLPTLRLQTKMLLLALGPVLLLSILLSGIAIVTLGTLADSQEEQTRANVIRDRRAELEHYVQIALNAIAPTMKTRRPMTRLHVTGQSRFWKPSPMARTVISGVTTSKVPVCCKATPGTA